MPGNPSDLHLDWTKGNDELEFILKESEKLSYLRPDGKLRWPHVNSSFQRIHVPSASTQEDRSDRVELLVGNI